MIDDHVPPTRQTITRTLTITTVETWSITIGAPLNPGEEIVVQQDVEEIRSGQGEEETCSTNRS